MAKTKDTGAGKKRAVPLEKTTVKHRAQTDGAGREKTPPEELKTKAAVKAAELPVEAPPVPQPAAAPERPSAAKASAAEPEASAAKAKGPAAKAPAAKTKASAAKAPAEKVPAGKTPAAEIGEPAAEEPPVKEPAEPAAPEAVSASPRRSVAFIGSECYPFVKTGGLGDVMYALPKALVKQNCDVKVILPRSK